MRHSPRCISPWRPLTEAELPQALDRGREPGFDLAVEPPLRAHLFVLGEHEQCCSCCSHHIAGDGWSLAPLWRDRCCRVCGAQSKATRLSFAPLPVQYADYTLWQHQVLGAKINPEQCHSAAAFVLDDTLQELPAQFELPTDRPRPAVSSYHGDHVPRADRCRNCTAPC